MDRFTESMRRCYKSLITGIRVGAILASPQPQGMTIAYTLYTSDAHALIDVG